MAFQIDPAIFSSEQGLPVVAWHSQWMSPLIQGPLEKILPLIGQPFGAGILLASCVIAGAFGFLTFAQCAERPER
jgi:hypothetical protein